MLTIVNMYMLIQEVEVWYVIPSVRKELSKILTSKYGMSYEKVGRILGISKAAVSQYISDKRANKIKLSKKTKEQIEISAEIIYNNNSLAVNEIQRILKFMRENGESCEVCGKYNKNILKYCKRKVQY